MKKGLEDYIHVAGLSKVKQTPDPLFCTWLFIGIRLDVGFIGLAIAFLELALLADYRYGMSMGLSNTFT